MPSPKRIGLLLAAFLFASVIVALIATTFGEGQTAGPREGESVRVLRHKGEKNRIPTTQELESSRQQAGSKEEKRKLTMRDFKDMPVKFHAIRNVDSETWYKDLQIEVKNIGAKPIYFMLAYLDFPDHKNPEGRDTGIFLTFGDQKYWDIGVFADPQDLHLDPGQNYVFTIPEKMAKGLAISHGRVPQEYKKLDFHIDIISFGDRTGFEIGHPLDLRNTKQPDGAGSKKHHGKNLSARSPPQDGCGPCGRYTTQPAQTCFDLSINEWCAPAPLIQVNQSQPCRLYRTTYYDCDGDGFEECPRDDIYDSADCPGYVPTPTPTPTPIPGPSPEPSCDLAERPNPTNCACVGPIVEGGNSFWFCSCGLGDYADYRRFPGPQGLGGCDPSKSQNNGADCCICTGSIFCPDGQPRDSFSCECPSPTPTPTLSGGGGDGGGTGGGGYSCTEYDWVLYNYMNGRWVEVARWSAGCF